MGKSKTIDRMPRDRLMSVDEAARIVGCHPRTIRNAIWGKKLVALTLPKARGLKARRVQVDRRIRIFIDPADLSEWLEVYR